MNKFEDFPDENFMGGTLKYRRRARSIDLGIWVMGSVVEIYCFGFCVLFVCVDYVGGFCWVCWWLLKLSGVRNDWLIVSRMMSFDFIFLNVFNKTILGAQ